MCWYRHPFKLCLCQACKERCELCGASGAEGEGSLQPRHTTFFWQFPLGLVRVQSGSLTGLQVHIRRYGGRQSTGHPHSTIATSLLACEKTVLQSLLQSWRPTLAANTQSLSGPLLLSLRTRTPLPIVTHRRSIHLSRRARTTTNISRRPSGGPTTFTELKGATQIALSASTSTSSAMGGRYPR